MTRAPRTAAQRERDARSTANRRHAQSAAARAHFDAVMQRRAAEHRALCFVFRIPSAPAEFPPSAIEIESRHS